jgi:hypothetical protein
MIVRMWHRDEYQCELVPEVPGNCRHVQRLKQGGIFRDVFFHLCQGSLGDGLLTTSRNDRQVSPIQNSRIIVLEISGQNLGWDGSPIPSEGIVEREYNE